MTQQTIEKMLMMKFSSYQPIGLVLVDNVEDLKVVKGVPLVTNSHTLLESIEVNPIDGVFVSLLMAPNQEIEKLNGYTALSSSIKSGHSQTNAD